MRSRLLALPLWLITCHLALVTVALAPAQIPTSNTTTVTVNKTTGAIAGPVSAATFRAANAIPTGTGNLTGNATVTGGNLTVALSGATTVTAVGNATVGRALTAGTGLTVTNGDGVAGNPTVSLANTAVAAGTYGGATAAPSIVVDAQGRLTSAGNVTVTPAVGSLTGLGSGVGTLLATPTSANLRAALTDESGTGAALFQNGDIGAATGTSLSLSGSLTALNATILTSGTGNAFSLGAAGTSQGYLRIFSTTSGREANIYAPSTGGLQIDTAGNGYPIVLNGSAVTLAPGSGGTSVTGNLTVSGNSTVSGATSGENYSLVQNSGSGTTTRAVQSLSNGSYSAGIALHGGSFTNVGPARANRSKLYGPFDLNYVSGQHRFWIGGGGDGTQDSGAAEVLNVSAVGLLSVSGVGNGISLNGRATGGPALLYQNADTLSVFGNSADRFQINTSNGNATVIGNLTVSGTGANTLNGTSTAWTRSGYVTGVLEHSNTSTPQITSSANFRINATNTVTIDGGSGVAIRGTNTNDNAATGYVGEYVSSTLIPASAIALVNNTSANVTSISLTAGDWDVTGVVVFSGGATTGTQSIAQISDTSATFTAFTPGNFNTQPTVPTAVGDVTHTVPSLRVSVSGTVTRYLVVRMLFSAGAPTAYGTLTARRVR